MEGTAWFLGGIDLFKLEACRGAGQQHSPALLAWSPLLLVVLAARRAGLQATHRLHHTPS
jgi:hypothetical protein